MTNKHNIVFFLALMMPGGILWGQEFCHRVQVPEQLSYKVYYNAGFLKIYGGDVIFSAGRVWDNPNTLMLTSTGKTRPAYTWIYRINDLYKVKYRCDLNRSVTFFQHTIEGNMEKHWEYHYKDLDSVTIINKITSETLVQSGHPSDLLTAVYMTRFLPFEHWSVGQMWRITTLINDSVEELCITYHGITKIKTGMDQIFDTYFITAQIPGGTLFKKDRDLQVYISLDRYRKPVMISAPVAIGSVRAVLSEDNE